MTAQLTLNPITESQYGDEWKSARELQITWHSIESTALQSQNLTQKPDHDYPSSLGGEESWASHRQDSLRDLAQSDLEAFTSVKEYDIEVEYQPGRIPMEGDLYLQLNDPTGNPLRIGFSYDTGTVEIIGWGLSVPSEERAELPLHIGRRFFDLYCHSLSGTLDEQGEACLELVSRQVDYRSYIAKRSLPRYHEATLIRRQPVLLLQFLDQVNLKLDMKLAPALRLLKDGDRFGAWFTTAPDGTILAIQSPVKLPLLETTFQRAELLQPSKPVEFPDSLRALLPKPPSHKE